MTTSTSNPTPREYALDGESKALYNGARDTQGGIWLRIRDENDRRILGAAVEKQSKNQQAASGTLVALDPNAGHLVDYVGEALERVKNAINGARPSSAQLDGTPIGAALSEPPSPNGAASSSAGDAAGSPAKGRGAKGKSGKGGRRAGEPTRVGDVLAGVPNGPLSDTLSRAGTTAGDALSPPTPSGITWAARVPSPRPEPGDTLRLASGAMTTIAKAIGFDADAVAFRVDDSADWNGLVVHHGPTGEWRMLSRLLDYDAYDERIRAPEAEFPADALAEAAGAEAGAWPGSVAPEIAAALRDGVPAARKARQNGVPRAEPPKAASTRKDSGSSSATKGKGKPVTKGKGKR